MHPRTVVNKTVVKKVKHCSLRQKRIFKTKFILNKPIDLDLVLNLLLKNYFIALKEASVKNANIPEVL